MNTQDTTIKIGSASFRPVDCRDNPAEAKVYYTSAGPVIFFGEVQMMETSFADSGDESLFLVFRRGGALELKIAAGSRTINFATVEVQTIEQEPLLFLAADISLKKIELPAKTPTAA